MKILNDFNNHLGQINCLENEKIRNQKKRHAGTISIFDFSSNSYSIFENFIWNHLYINCEDFE